MMIIVKTQQTHFPYLMHLPPLTLIWVIPWVSCLLSYNLTDELAYNHISPEACSLAGRSVEIGLKFDLRI